MMLRRTMHLNGSFQLRRGVHFNCALTMVATAPTLAAEPGQTPASAVFQATPINSPIRGRTGSGSAQTLWTTSNQFGTQQASVQTTQAGSSVSRMSFTNLNGETLHVTATSGGVEMVSGAGSVSLTKLANGHWIETVFVKPGACASEPDNPVAATGGTATRELDVQGHPLDGSPSATFVSTQQALGCATAAVRSDMADSMQQAGLVNASGSPVYNPEQSGTGLPGQMHTDVFGLGACGSATLDLGVAYAGVAIAATGDIFSGGLASFVLVGAVYSYFRAVTAYHEAC